jgi:hypothetical protein
MEMSFFCHMSFYREAMHLKEQGEAFFCYALLCFDNCPEKRDESNLHTIIGWLQFIRFFGTLQSSIFQGHKAKKGLPLFPSQKDISMLSDTFLS